MSKQALLGVADLSVSVRLEDGGLLPVLSDIAFSLDRGETLGIAGESGSGKTILSLAIMGLLPPGAVVSGNIALDGQPLLNMSDAGWDAVRGRRIGMIFQEPLTALNPAMTVADQIAEGIVFARGASWRDARREAVLLLDRVRIAEAARRGSSYPHELSGGQRQRVGIAIALALEPDLLIADEPTTALDVSVQAGILDLLGELVRDTGMALLLVSHNPGVIARSTSRTLMLYAGTRMEEGRTAEVLGDPRNPYTRSLLAAMPARRAGHDRLHAIPGSIPHPARLPAGCRFRGRCPSEIAACSVAEPAWRPFGSGRGVRCLRADLSGEADA